MKRTDIKDAESMLMELLPAYGYEPVESDKIMLRNAWALAEFRVLSFCNIDSIPDELQLEVANMAVGSFLKAKKASGQLYIENDGEGGLRFPHKVTQFTEGDTSMSFTPSGKDDEAVFNKMADDLERGHLWILEHYRRLHW